MIPHWKELSHFLEKVVLLARRSARKRIRFARSLGGEGNRIVRSFGWEGNKNTRRCKGKGIESQNIGMSRNFFFSFKKKANENALNIFKTQKEENSIPFPLYLRVFLFPSHPKLRAILFPSCPKLRAILFLFRTDLQARRTTFPRKWLKSFNWGINLKNCQRGKTYFWVVLYWNPLKLGQDIK